MYTSLTFATTKRERERGREREREREREEEDSSKTFNLSRKSDQTILYVEAFIQHLFLGSIWLWTERWTSDQMVWGLIPVLVMCRSVEQTSHSTLPWSTQLQWVPGYISRSGSIVAGCTDARFARGDVKDVMEIWIQNR